jgi:hypothetical protein
MIVISGIHQIDKVHPLDDTAIVNIETGNDAGFEH